jgi:hypothetical protein
VRIQVKASLSGIVRQWWNSAGCGYVIGSDGFAYFIPFGSLPDGLTQLKINQPVRFDSSDGETARILELLAGSAI